MTTSLRRALAPIAALALVASALPSAARADDSPHLIEARQALEALRYRDALAALERAIQTGDNGPDEIRTAYRMLGEVHAALGERRDAEAAFRRLLALNPDAELGPGVSPKLARPFEAARDATREAGPIVVRCVVDDAAGTVRLEVEADPVELIAGARVVYRRTDGSEQQAETSGSGNLVLGIPVEDRTPLVCAAIDEHGNRLVEIGSWDDPLVLSPAAATAAASAPAPPPAPARSTPVYARWYVWGAAAVVTAGAGGYFAWAADQDQAELDRLNQDSAEHSFSEARAVEESGKRNALIANIGFGVAGGMALGAALTLLLAPDEPTERELSVTPMAVPRGAGVAVTLPLW
ncbi:tetratricopeptide repeat protein [Haliangium sp.]|uniref:tetratricopeptide repeat protein n=1 Tax=Haliangium sp. TaxID=2663208 RepID=UPI003D0B89C5